MRYVRETPRIPTTFANADTEEVLLEIKDRTQMDVGDVHSAYFVNGLFEGELKNKRLPRKLMVISVSIFELEE